VSRAVRTATADDREALEPMLPAFMQPAWKRARLDRALANGEVRVMEDAGTIVGFSWLTEFIGHTFVNVLAVDERARRRGYAGELLAAALAEATTDRIFTSTNVSNAPMHAVLDRYGWKRCGEVDELDPGDPEVFYVKRLAARPQSA
jgi:GNAT superfamily N-acetyltransferase